ncbi:PAS domain S-box protein [Sphingosinithalassobacter portus]|uniref:PAS domain S-box protein n=1 Tax=Stakelama portus TaxID=2676234 RepID=UPI0011AB45C7|nr:PAS domain S-box protein [Sphingosinithalassobacter portus]
MATTFQRPAEARAFSLARLAVPFAIAIVYATIAWVMTLLSGRTERVDVVWLPNAMLLGIMFWRRLEGMYSIAILCLIAKTTKNLLIGDDFLTAAGYSTASIAEVLIAARLACILCAGAPRWNDLTQLFRFGIAAGVVAPAISATVAALALAQPLGSFDSHVWLDWFTTAGLGLAMGTPIFAILIESARGLHRVPGVTLERWLLILGGVIVGTLVIFTQTQFPLLFLAGPLALVAAFQLGAAGAASATLVIALIAALATSHGYGPIQLVHGTLHDRVLVLQSFLLTIFLSALPVTAALSARARLAREFAESRDFAQSTLDEIRDIIFRTDAKGRWTFLNPAWERITGAPVDQSLGRPIREWMPEDTELDRTFVEQVIQGEQIEARFDQSFRYADGSTRQGEVHVRALHDADGALIGTIGNIRDVTEERMAAQAIAEGRRRLQTLADVSPAGILRTDPEGGLTFANPAWEHVSGLRFVEAQGVGWARALHPDDAGRVQQEWGEAVQAGRNYTGEFRFVWRDGTVRWVAASAAPEVDEQGNLAGFVAITLDITDRKAMERDIEAARAQAEEAARAKSRFLANMSHEIRTPMNGVIGFTDMLLAGELSDEQRTRAEAVAGSGKAMMRLLNDILDLSKIEAGQMTITPEPYEIARVLNHTAALFEPVARTKGLALRTELSADLPPFVRGDSLRVRQIVANLIGNAVKFTERGGVTLSAEVETGRGEALLAISVKDSGIGVPPERQAAVFGEFTQADDGTARVYGGTGLGLSISRRLAELMGGTLTLESIVGLGSVFCLRLPLEIAEGEAGAAPHPLHAAPEIPEAIPARVLVAEDHDINQQLVTAMLERLGATVTLVKDGGEAVAAVVQAHAEGALPDLMLMDMQMPVLDGLEAARRIRASGIDSEMLPIVAVTANAYGEDVRACINAGMQAHVAKPLRLDALASALRRWAKAPGATPIHADVASPAGQREIDPALAPMWPKFEALCERCAQAANRVAEALPDASQEIREELYQAMHKLAGSAALFGETELGDAARAVEDGVRGETENGDAGLPLETGIAHFMAALVRMRGNLDPDDGRGRPIG